jgi:hypothetical protein
MARLKVLVIGATGSVGPLVGSPAVAIGDVAKPKRALRRTQGRRRDGSPHERRRAKPLWKPYTIGAFKTWSSQLVLLLYALP